MLTNRRIECGKSTFIRCINHLEKYQEGSISIFGQELGNDKKSAAIIRQNIGMLFQSFNLFPHLTLLQNCTLGPIWLRKIPEAKAIEQATLKMMVDFAKPCGGVHLPASISARNFWYAATAAL